MTVGIIKELYPGERRVAMIPSQAANLVKGAQTAPREEVLTGSDMPIPCLPMKTP